MRIEKRSMNWVPKQPVWKEMEARQAKNRENRANDEALMSAITENLSSVSSNATFEAGNLAAKRAIARLSEAAVAKVQANASAVSEQATRDVIWRNKTV